jgi:hypothetical protein
MKLVLSEYVLKLSLIIKDLLEENLNVKEKNTLHLEKLLQIKLEKIINNFSFKNGIK